MYTDATTDLEFCSRCCHPRFFPLVFRCLLMQSMDSLEIYLPVTLLHLECEEYILLLSMRE